jgi:hypothetical protein
MLMKTKEERSDILTNATMLMKKTTYFLEPTMLMIKKIVMDKQERRVTRPE